MNLKLPSKASAFLVSLHSMANWEDRLVGPGKRQRAKRMSLAHCLVLSMALVASCVVCLSCGCPNEVDSPCGDQTLLDVLGEGVSSDRVADAGILDTVDTGTRDMGPEDKQTQQEDVREVEEDTSADNKPQDALPEGCCSIDSDCQTGFVCVFPSSSETVGVCAPYPQQGSCYSSSDCAYGYGCFDSVRCDCGDPFCEIQLGFCHVQGATGICCTSDADCPPELQCVVRKDDPQMNACLVKPREDECWTDADCETDEVCVGAKWGPCCFIVNTQGTMGEFGDCVPAQENRRPDGEG